MIKKCQNPDCGKEFLSSRKDQRYCCIRCRRHVQDAKRKVKLKETVCQQCGKTYMPKRRDQLFCSNKCRWMHQKTAKKKPEQEKECIVCGMMFLTTSARRETCSKECRDDLYSDRRLWFMYTGKTEKPRESQIDAINQKAREAGMTYGQYQALHSGMIPTAETAIRSYRERTK